MRRQRHEPAWPFLCILAFLFVLSLTWPRSWQRPVRDVPGGYHPGEGDAGSATAVRPHRALPAGRHGDGRCGSVAGLGDGLEARETAVTESAESSPRLEEALGRVTDLQLAEPAGKLGGRPLAFDWSGLPLPVPALLAGRPAPAEQVAATPVESTGAAGGEDLASSGVPPSAANVDSASDETTDGTSTPDAATPEASAHDARPAWIGAWPEPVALLDRLEALAGDRQTGPWASAVADEVRRLGSAGPEDSGQQVPSIVERLSRLNRQADDLAIELGDRPLAITLRRAQYALARRLAVWRPVIAAGGPAGQSDGPSEPNPQRLRSCLARVGALTRDSAAGQAWRKYLDLDALERLAGRPAEDPHQRCTLVRRILDRLNRPGMSAKQRAFVDGEPLAELESELRHWAAEPVDLGQLLRRLEAYEQTGLSSHGRLLAEDGRRLRFSPDPDHRELSRQVDAHYRNANVRIAITAELLNRLVPEREPEFRYVNDRVMGKPVHGRSVTFSDVGVRMIPDPSRLRCALRIKGLVSSLTSSTSGPATFCNNSEAAYLALKEIEIGTWGLRLRPAEVAADSTIRLRSARTSLDVIPLVGVLAEEIARSQHERSRPEMCREVERKVALQAKRQIDAEADARLDMLNQKLHDRVLQPLEGLSLGPTMISAQTTERRLVMRLRLAADEQLAASTPRPRAPADSLASCQIHESALNNAIDQLGLDGGTFTLAEIRGRIAEVSHRPEMLAQDPGRDDVRITFVDNDAVRVRCQEGRIAVTLTIDKMSSWPNHWKDFRVRAYYRPEIDGRSVRLARDGLIELDARKRLGSQITLRGIFAGTFSRQHPWQPIPELLATDPRFAGLAVTQFVIDDGWIGVAFGPDRSAQPPLIARQDDETLD
jgi:hypothetical protein